MIELTSDRFDRFPKLARDHITSLREEIAQLREALAIRDGLSDPATDTWLDGYGRQDRVPLRKGGRIEFVMSDDKYANGEPIDYLHCRIEHPGEMEIMASATVHIEPQVSNVIRIRVSKRRGDLS